jgi:hypothetical protein
LEQAKGLNPNLASDRNGTQLSADGYTNLEMYLNELAGDPVVYVNQVPTVTWSLTQSATSAGTQLSVQSTPVDRDGRVAKVDVLHNGVVVKTLLAAPWNADLAGVPAGNHVVQLRVTDNQGAVVVSEAKYATVLGRSGLRVLENPWRGIANMEFQLTATQTKQKVSFRVIRVGAGLVRAFTLANPTTGLNRMRVVSSKTYPAGNYQIVMLLDGVVYETVLARKF